MPYYLPKGQNEFPDPALADETGLLAIGGNLSTPSLINAYRKGIFPWFMEEDIIYWYSPDPRFVLFPDELKISRSMKKVIRDEIFNFTIDKDFPSVIGNCSSVKRKSGQGTWINKAFQSAYTNLFDKGYAHSGEAWSGKDLEGGLYGVRFGKIFFGESMFTKKNNASKFVFINMVHALKNEGIVLIDCQVYTPHLESLGARFISRDLFTQLVQKLS
jgi:leucyl/phenylalanyl-tRNA---protein transferase